VSRISPPEGLLLGLLRPRERKEGREAQQQPAGGQWGLGGHPGQQACSSCVKCGLLSGGSKFSHCQGRWGQKPSESERPFVDTLNLEGDLLQLLSVREQGEW
jgi:hypothetical protein